MEYVILIHARVFICLKKCFKLNKKLKNTGSNRFSHYDFHWFLTGSVLY